MKVLIDVPGQLAKLTDQEGYRAKNELKALGYVTRGSDVFSPDGVRGVGQHLVINQGGCVDAGEETETCWYYELPDLVELIPYLWAEIDQLRCQLKGIKTSTIPTT